MTNTHTFTWKLAQPPEPWGLVILAPKCLQVGAPPPQPTSYATSPQGPDSFVHSQRFRSINCVPDTWLSQGTRPGTRRAGPGRAELTFWSEETVCKEADK